MNPNNTNFISLQIETRTQEELRQENDVSSIIISPILKRKKNVENKQRYVAKKENKTYMEVRWWVGCYEACMYVQSIEK